MITIYEKGPLRAGTNVPKKRRRLVKILRLLFLFVLFVWLWPSQGYSIERFQVSAHFSLGFPQQEFRQNIDRIGIGGAGSFAYKFKNSPFSAGVSLGVLVYGFEKRPELLNAWIPEVVVDVATRNYILVFHIVLRVQPTEGKFRPYVEGLAGFHYLWTETGIYDQGWSQESIASSVNLDDWTWSAGAGCGISVVLYEHRKIPDHSSFVMLVELGDGL